MIYQTKKYIPYKGKKFQKCKGQKNLSEFIFAPKREEKKSQKGSDSQNKILQKFLSWNNEQWYNFLPIKREMFGQ